MSPPGTRLTIYRVFSSGSGRGRCITRQQAAVLFVYRNTRILYRFMTAKR